MAETAHDRAVRLEGLFPRVLRTLFRPNGEDPLVDLPIGQMRMMRLLEAKSWTPSSLGEELGLSVSAVTQMANRLDSTGMLAREEDPADRRVKHLMLTPLGKEKMRARRERRVRLLESVLVHMKEERQDEFIKMLEELLDASAIASKSEDHTSFVDSEMEQFLPISPPYFKEN